MPLSSTPYCEIIDQTIKFLVGDDDMKNVFIGLLTLVSFSSFAGDIVCQEGGQLNIGVTKVYNPDTEQVEVRNSNQPNRGIAAIYNPDSGQVEFRRARYLDRSIQCVYRP